VRRPGTASPAGRPDAGGWLDRLVRGTDRLAGLRPGRVGRARTGRPWSGSAPARCRPSACPAAAACRARSSLHRLLRLTGARAAGVRRVLTRLGLGRRLAGCALSRRVLHRRRVRTLLRYCGTRLTLGRHVTTRSGAGGSAGGRCSSPARGALGSHRRSRPHHGHPDLVAEGVVDDRAEDDVRVGVRGLRDSWRLVDLEQARSEPPAIDAAPRARPPMLASSTAGDGRLASATARSSRGRADPLRGSRRST